ncbi:hypothetical protein BU17DRAFT_39042 [Hysterangium stoloniferum]|nr:hypothetical protein BU17DRAFT_39042 [Hysterangium stoloniferum]
MNSTDEPASSSTNEEAKECRICQGGPEDVETCGRLIKPCMCKGTMQYVHVKCLNQWRKSSGSKSAFYQCHTCHYSYAFARTSAAGLATSPLVLGLASILLFTVLVFTASFLVSYLVPSLATPSYSLETQSVRELLMLPVSMANRVAGYAARSYDAYHFTFWWSYHDDDAWDAPVEDETLLKHPSEVGFLTMLVHRFILGLSTVGSLSMLAFVSQVRLLNRGYRVNRNRGERTTDSIFPILVLVLVAIGIARALRNIYRFNHSMAHRILIRVEQVILEVA